MELKALANQVDSLKETDGPPDYKTLTTPLLETHDSSEPMDSIANFPSTFETNHFRLAGFDLNVEPKISIACDVAPHLPDSSISFPEFTSQHLPTLSNETPFFSAQVHPTPSRAVPVCATQTTATLPRSKRFCESRPRVRFSKADSCHGTQCGSTQVHMKPHMGTQQSHPTFPRDHSDTTQFHIIQPFNTLDTIISTSSNTSFFHCSFKIAALLSHTEPPPGHPLHQTFSLPSWAFDDQFLPKPEIGKFDGDPMKYKSFRNNFETHIESKFRDPKILLCLLLQHCKAKVKNQIEHFSNKGIDGYGLALDRLEREYGQSWVIADACERRLQKFVNVKSNDLGNLRMFADLLEKTEVLSKDIQCYGSLNSSGSITTLVNKLPYDMRRAWVRESVAIENRTNRIASFGDLTSFVINKSMEANSLYGRRILASANKPSSNIKTSRFFSSNSVSADFPLSSTLVSSHALASSSFCFFCDSPNHILLNCPKFLKAPGREQEQVGKIKETLL